MAEHIADLVSRGDLQVFTEAEMRKLVAKLDVSGDFDMFNYTPPGPVAQQFITSTYLTKVIMGPLGGGKTTACAFARIYAATLAPIARHPDDKKHTRMCRWIVLRDTFRSVEKTVLESWKQWFPKGYPGSSWAGGNDRPVTHTLRFIGPDGIRIEAITEFAGLGEMDVESLMKGREYSGAWLNELDTHAAGALDDMEQRVGRYPKADILVDPNAKRMRMVIGDMNAPTLDNWTYQSLVINVLKTPDRILFRQPSGRSAEAENRFYLELDYYDRIIRNQEEHFIRRMVDNEFGYSRAGKPVFESFSRDRNVSKRRLEHKPELTIDIGIDTSMNTLNPAAVFMQSWAPGRIAMFDELYMGHGVGAARFGEALNQRIYDKYRTVSKIRLWFDPAAQYGADREGGQLAAMETISIICGLPALIPGNGSNEIGLRLDAWKAEIRGYLEPETQLLVCPYGCPLLVEALAGKYRYKRLTAKSSIEYEEKPEKTHPASDVADAGGYGIIGIRGRMGVLRGAAGEDPDRQAKRNGPWGNQQKRAGGFDPHKVGQ